MIWQLQEAKSKFSQLINCALAEGPQFVTRHGQKVVVLLSIKDYRAVVPEEPLLLDLLINSPLAGSDLVIERDDTDFGRELVL